MNIGQGFLQSPNTGSFKQAKSLARYSTIILSKNIMKQIQFSYLIYMGLPTTQTTAHSLVPMPTK